MVLTPWFHWTDRPVRSGPYQVRGKSEIFYSFYDTETQRWGFVSHTPEGAVGMREKPSKSQHRDWRGIWMEAP